MQPAHLIPLHQPQVLTGVPTMAFLWKPGIITARPFTADFCRRTSLGLIHKRLAELGHWIFSVV